MPMRSASPIPTPAVKAPTQSGQAPLQYVFYIAAAANPLQVDFEPVLRRPIGDRRRVPHSGSSLSQPQKYEGAPWRRACYHETMRHIVYKVETEVETDARWIAEIPDLPGVLAYGSTEKEAVASAQALALHVLADRIEEQKEPAETVTVSIEAA
jgi:predicted RNase H-like HicB family nuclease